MSTSVPNQPDSGLEVLDLYSDSAFAARRLHVHNAATQLACLNKLAQAFVEKPETILQELVNAAIEICGADSAGISTQNEDERGETYYHWVATAGQYSSFFNAILPGSPSACGMTLDRGKPQLFRVGQPFFDLLRVEAPTVTDGILIPWHVEELRGTIWIVAHGRHEAFDSEDARMMEALANFTAMAVKQERQQRHLMRTATAAAASAMANELAHKINNPLQCLTNTIYLASHSEDSVEIKRHIQSMSTDMQRLTELIHKLLTLRIDMPKQ